MFNRTRSIAGHANFPRPKRRVDWGERITWTAVIALFTGAGLICVLWGAVVITVLFRLARMLFFGVPF